MRRREWSKSRNLNSSWNSQLRKVDLKSLSNRQRKKYSEIHNPNGMFFPKLIRTQPTAPPLIDISIHPLHSSPVPFKIWKVDTQNMDHKHIWVRLSTWHQVSMALTNHRVSPFPTHTLPIESSLCNSAILDWYASYDSESSDDSILVH